MKKTLTTLLCSLVSVLLFAGHTPFDFLNNNNKVVSGNQLIIFYRADCPFCDKLSNNLKAENEFVNEVKRKFKMQVVDITTPEGRILANQFNIRSVPAVVNFNILSGESSILKGAVPVSKFASFLDIPFQFKNSNPQKVINSIISSQKNMDIVSLGVCGNGLVEAGETCDDANINSGDGCSSSCNVEPGFQCTGQPSVCTTVCGDGIITGAETCDDANTTSGDGCNNNCTVEPGYQCTGQPSVCITVCGDGIVAPTEGCDDGNTTNGDGCSSSCGVEPGYICTGQPSVCTNTPPPNDECAGAISMSGNSGIINGNNITATNSAGIPTPSCQGNITRDMWYVFALPAQRNISIAVNGPTLNDPVLVIYSGTCGALTQVACDDDGGPGTYSLIQTSLNAGVYYVRAGGYNTNTGSFQLVYNLGSSVCGNNILEANEECDDGNTANGDGCSSTCLFENTSSVTGAALNTDGTRPNPSSMLDVKSSDKGILIPRMTTGQRTVISNPAKGLVVYDITTNSFWFYNGGAWQNISTSNPVGFSASKTSGQVLGVGGTAITVTFPNQNSEDGGDIYNTGTSVFTPPGNGTYQLSSSLQISHSVSAAFPTTYTISILSNTSSHYGSQSLIVPANATGFYNINISALVVPVAIADGLKITITASGLLGSPSVSSGSFNAVKIY